MDSLALISQTAWTRYAERIAGASRAPWWTVVIITASSARQAARYEWEIQRRREQGKLPAGVRYAVIADPEDRRVGSGVGMRERAEVGTQHGVCVHDDHGRVYAFLQKPAIDDVRAAGGLLPGQMSRSTVAGGRR